MPEDCNVHLGSYFFYGEDQHPRDTPEYTSNNSSGTKPRVSEYTTPLKAKKELALIILNQSIPHANTTLFPALWDKAAHRLCADGGGNRLYDFAKERNAVDDYIPDAIIGDLDSLDPATREFYQEKGALICHSEDQSSTDLMKCLRYLDNDIRKGQDPQDCIVVVVGGLNGRVDHGLHVLKTICNEHKRRQMLVISLENLTFVLPEGKNKILINHDIDGPTCGILPLAGESILTTRGLRWNLDRYPSTFEGLMSTSNIIDDKEVFVESSRHVIWTSELRPRIADSTLS